VRARPEVKGHLEIGHRFGVGVDPIGGLLKPAGDFGHLKRFERVGIEAGEADAAPLRAPDAEIRRLDKERTAIRIQRQARLRGLPLEPERDDVADRAFFPVMASTQNAGARLK